MLKIKVIFLLQLICMSVYSQNYTISGFVEDDSSGERIIGAYVTDSISKSVSQTNNFGFYMLRRISNKTAIKATYIGMGSMTIYSPIHHDTIINLSIHPVLTLHEVQVSAFNYKRKVNSPLGLITIPVNQLNLIPALGESDLLKSIQTQPGIKGGIEGSAGIFVRGGGAGENMFMLDDVPMYNVSHLYGFFSAFNNSAIKDIKLIKGCFPARYGGRVSSVIDIRSLDGNTKSVKGEASIGVISSKINIEGPINKETSFILSGRRSYFDLYSGMMRNTGLLDNNFPNYSFYDFNMRISHTFSPYDRIYLSFYKGKDNIRTVDDMDISTNDETNSYNKEEISGWGNFIGSIRWNHAFGSKLFANTTIAFSKYDYFTSDQSRSKIDTIVKSYSANYQSDISDILLKTDFDFSITNSHHFKFGAGNTFHTFSLGENTYHMIDTEWSEKTDTAFSNTPIETAELFVYFEDEIIIKEKLLINSGLRSSAFICNGQMPLNLEPRISANYSINPQLVIKTGYSRMVQYMHLLSSSGTSLPTDIWIPAIKGLQPMKSDQIDVGISFKWLERALITVEAYRKWMKNSTDYRNGASLLADFSPWYDKTTQGRGDSKGVEISIEKHVGKLQGSINYTLSSATRRFTDLNNGSTFPFRYDRRHDFNISLNVKISDKWDVSALWIYGTGYYVTIPVEKHIPAFNMMTRIENPWFIYYYPSLNNCRLPPYHRLDIGVHYTKNKKNRQNSISLDIFNAYDRKNAVTVYYWDDYCFKYKYLLPIIPSITYTLKFK
jgi:hypothetical protein